MLLSGSRIVIGDLQAPRQIMDDKNILDALHRMVARSYLDVEYLLGEIHYSVVCIRMWIKAIAVHTTYWIRSLPSLSDFITFIIF